MAGIFASSVLPEILGTTALEDAAYSAAIPLLDTTAVDAGGVLAGIGVDTATTGAAAGTAAATGAGTAAATDVVPGIAATPLPTATASQGINAAPNMAQVVPPDAAVPSSVTYQAPNGLGVQNPAYTSGVDSAGQFAGNNGVGVNASGLGAGQASSGILGNALDPIMNGFKDASTMLKGAGAFAKENPMATMMGLRLAQNAFGPSYAQPTVKKPTGQAMDMTLSPNFKGSHVISDTSVYNPTYTQPTKVAAQGGVMRGYASGGILSFDQGGIAAMAPGGGIQGQTSGMGNNQNYPQGRLDSTQFAAPSQMPISSAAFSTDMEQKTNPYTGEPAPGMAGGGAIAFSAGGSYAEPTQMDTSHISMLGSPSAWSTNQDTDANTAHLAPHEAAAYRQQKLENLVGYANRAKQAPAPMGFNQMSAPQQAQMAAQGAQQSQAGDGQFAAGGILGADHSTLGGYAAGGAPRLLKGPGDGMSDSIPAVIGHKQPARLASGEFVIPADVVSHLGNGDTDAGSKQLHSMMDNVRKARTGNKKQGKQIDPNNFLPA